MTEKKAREPKHPPSSAQGVQPKKRKPATVPGGKTKARRAEQGPEAQGAEVQEHDGAADGRQKQPQQPPQRQSDHVPPGQDGAGRGGSVVVVVGGGGGGGRREAAHGA